MIQNYAYTLLASLLLLWGCKEETTQQETPAPASLDGIYRSVGYGRLLEISGDTIKTYDHQKRYCSKSNRSLVSELGDHLVFKDDTLRFMIGYDTYYYTPLNWEPAICNIRYTQEQLQDPVLNFEVLANTFKEHYAYWELNQLDWYALYTAHRNQIDDTTTEVELFQVLDSFIEQTNDMHGNLEAPDEIVEAAQELGKPSEGRNYGDFEVASIFRSRILEEEFSKDSKIVRWGILSNGAGYLQINAMMLTAQFTLDEEQVKTQGWVSAYFEYMDSLNELEQLQAEMDGASQSMKRAIQDLKDTDYLIVDIRFNGGGVDEVGLEMLRYFNDSPKVFGTKKARLGDKFTPIIPLTLDASEAPYLKPVYLLTSPQTGSAAEIFSMASRVLPHVTRIGAATAGATSDMLEKQLPNGWYFGLSNEIYQDLEGISYENLGVPPDVFLPYSRDRQSFFRKVAEQPEQDLEQWLQTIDSLSR